MIHELSIIIPTLNEAGYLPRLLNSIAEQTYIGKLQVIVVDGYSVDKTSEIAKSFGNRIADLLVLRAKRNIGHQRNFGAQNAKYHYLLFLDADVILPPDLIQEIARKVRLPEPFIVGTMHTTSHMNLIDRFFLLFIYLLLFCSWAAKVPAINGDFTLTTAANHKAIKGFVEGALLGEDIDYAIRSVKSGAKYKYFLRPTIIASDRRVRDMGRWRLLLLWTRGYLRVIKHGPIFPNEGFRYQFGHYKTPAAKGSSTKESRGIF